MQPLNVMRHLISKMPTVTKMNPYASKDLQRFKDKPKFLLPVGGKIFDLDSNLKGVPEVIRLPYDEFVMEFESFIHKDDMAAGLGYMDNMPARYANVEQIPYSSLVFVKQREDSFDLRVVTVIRGEGSSYIYSAMPFKSNVKNQLNANPAPGDSGLEITYDENDPEFVGSPVWETWMDNPALFEKIFKFVMVEPTLAVLELVTALECKNVRHESLEPRKLNKGAMKRGALPFDSYRVLTIVPNKPTNGNGSGSIGVDRHTPREHLRRGHVRVYQTGLKIWVQATVVNAGIGQVLNKDYKIK